MTFLQDPQMLQRQFGSREFLFMIIGIGRGNVSQEFFIIKRDFQQVRIQERCGQKAHVYFCLFQIADDFIGPHFQNTDLGQGIILFEQTYELRNNIGSHRRNDTQAKAGVQAFFPCLYQFLHLHGLL